MRQDASAVDTGGASKGQRAFEPGFNTTQSASMFYLDDLENSRRMVRLSNG